MFPIAYALLLAGCTPGILDPVGPVGAAQRAILVDSVVIMAGIVVPVILATLAIAWWFRASNTRAKRRLDFVYSGRLELLVWSVPLLIVIFLGSIAWIGAHRLEPSMPLPETERPLDVDVISLDWKWLFIYPESGVASVNRLVLPVGRPVRFRLTSSSVMNAFFVPRLGSMIYTMNGMTTRLNLQADRAGVFRGLSSAFSGDGFADTHFETHALAPGVFEEWLATTRRAGRELDLAAYQALARPSSAVPQSTYRMVEPGLFEAVVARRTGRTWSLPTGPLPSATQAE